MAIVNLNLIDSSKFTHRFTSCEIVDLPHNSQLTIVRALGHSPSPRVFLATLTTTCTSPSNTLDLVVKLATNAAGMLDLHMEEWAYGKLKEMQGVSIPLCYGLFEGMIHGEDVKFLLLEYCVPDRFLITELDILEMQYQTMLALIKIHRKDLCYGKLLDSSHVIVQNGSSRILSLSKVRPYGPSCKDISRFYDDDGVKNAERQCWSRELVDTALHYELTERKRNRGYNFLHI
ncbi:hypothetical protein JR316_0006328 [Psilocybe cubensis]|uniref:Uncharacterized protein n=2 Tax=Psilocybe cubensis TaxID=181762 RepID=A0ACB8H1U0_PSICU|nr:hypothetical protein JR316_0006328 [Psilocybe cubensis]KAH9481801.1 hypothetical protein JR316_0006328 [Psilocybe cubensis]